MNKRPYGLGVALVIVGAVVGVGAARVSAAGGARGEVKRGSDDATLEGSRTRDDSLAREVGQLRRELAGVRSVAALRAVASAEPAAEEAPQEQEIPSSSSRLPPEEWQERQHEFLASTFETLERDKEHSFEVEGQLNQIFAPGNVAGTRMTSNLCASTMCKVTLAHDDESSQIAVGMAITGKPPFDGPAYFFYSKEGDTPVTTVYVGRRGEVLPISPELQEP